MAVSAEEVVDCFVAAWAAVEPERLALLRRAFTEDAVMVGGHDIYRGVEEIHGFICEAQADDSPIRAERISEIDSHGGWLRFEWRASTLDGSEAVEGVDVAELDGDGRVRQLIVFHPLRLRSR